MTHKAIRFELLYWSCNQITGEPNWIEELLTCSSVITLLILHSVWRISSKCRGIRHVLYVILSKVLWLNFLHRNENLVNSTVLDCLWHRMCLILRISIAISTLWTVARSPCWLDFDIYGLLSTGMSSLLELFGVPKFICGLVHVSKRKCALISKIVLIFKSWG